MGDSVIGIDLHTKAQVELLAQGRIEDREMIHSLAEDVKVMSHCVSEMAIAFTAAAKDSERVIEKTDDLSSQISDPVTGLRARLVIVEKNQEVSAASNKIRWSILGVGTAIGITLLTGFAGFIYWVIRTIPTPV